MHVLSRDPARARVVPFALLLAACAPTLEQAQGEIELAPAEQDEDEVLLGLEEDPLPEWGEPREGADYRAPADVAGLPGEFEPVERVLFGWHAGNWQYLSFFARVMRTVVTDAKVQVAVESEYERTLLRESLANEGVDVGGVDFVIHELDSMWIRDYGPILVRTHDGGYRVMDLPYHADRENDDGYPARFARDEGLPISQPPLEMEGGHIQSDGAGRCIVTDDLLRRNATYEYGPDELRRLLGRFFGCRQVTIVPALYGEETGHVDVLAYVTGPGRVLVGSYSREEDLVNSRRLDRAARLLREAGFEVTRIPMPGNSRRRVFRTYTNVLVLNHMVLVPVFRRDREHERRALRIFAEAFPDRRIVPIRSDGVMGLAGAIHCTAVALPALRPPARIARARRPVRPARRG